MLAALLDDPILADAPRKPSLANVDKLINLELGSAMRVTVVKLDGTSFDVILLNSATVQDLKMAIRMKTDEIEQEKMGHRHISWHISLNTVMIANCFLFLPWMISCDESCVYGIYFDSWKHIWDNYCLTHQNEKLIDDNSALSSNGI